MFSSIVIFLLLLIYTIRCNTNHLVEWSPCSKTCHPGYKYHIRSDDQLIELRSCFVQDPVCINNEYEKINEQKKIIQENRRQYISKTLIQIIISLSIAIGFTLTISSISFMYLFRDTFSIDSNYSIKTFEK